MINSPFLLLYILLTWLTGISFCNAQASSVGRSKDLYDELHNAKSDTDKISASIKLCEYYVEVLVQRKNNFAIDSITHYGQKAINLSQAIGYVTGEAEAYEQISTGYKIQRNFKLAEQYAQKAVDILLPGEDKVSLATAYRILASSNLDLRPVPETIEIQKKALKLYREAGLRENEADMMMRIAYQRLLLIEYDLAIVELNEALAIYQSVGMTRVERIYSTLAMIYNEKSEFNRALDYGLKAVQIIEYDSVESPANLELYNTLASIYRSLGSLENALPYLKKAYSIAKTYRYDYAIVGLEGNIQRMLMDMKREKEALVYLEELQKKINSPALGVKEAVVYHSLETYTRLKDKKNAAKYEPMMQEILNEMIQKNDNVPRQGQYMFSLANYYYLIANYDKSRVYADDAKKIYAKGKNIKVLAIIHERLYKLDSVQKNYLASLENFKQAQAYRDSIYTKASAEKFSELHMKYEIEKKNKDILLKDKSNRLLKQRAELQESRISKSNLIRNVSLAGVVILIVIIGLIYRRFRINKRIRAEIGLKNSALQSLLSEKEWLLKEIHHRVKNNLQIVMSLLNTQSHFLSDDKAKAAITNSQHRIHSMSLIHKKLYQSDNVVAIDMKVYITELVEYFKSSFDTGQRIRFETNIDCIEMKTEQAVPLGLILNEAITNSIKHAFPNDNEGVISIRLQLLEGNLVNLMIYDNGIGIKDKTDDKSFSSLGMRLIKGFSGELNAVLNFIHDNGFGISLDFKYDNSSGKTSSKISA